MEFTIEVEEVQPNEKWPVWPAAKLVLMVKVLSMIINIMEESGIPMNLQEENLTAKHEAFLAELEPLDKKQYLDYWDAFAADYLDWFKDYMASLDTGDVTEFTIPLSFEDMRNDLKIYVTFVFLRDRYFSLADRNRLQSSLYWCASVSGLFIDFAKARNQEMGEECEEVTRFLSEVCYALSTIEEDDQNARFKCIEHT